MVSTRDPYYFPKLQNDEDFVGPCGTQVRTKSQSEHAEFRVFGDHLRIFYLSLS